MREAGKIIIGSRGSRLALIQAAEVREALRECYPQFQFETRKIETFADTKKGLPFDKFDSSRVFVKQIEESLLTKEIDIAVHSLKDVPTQLPGGLVIGAVGKRKSSDDTLVSRQRELPQGARVGTGSLRRKIQLLRWRPDLNVLPLRGNVDGRLQKLCRGELDAIVVAQAALERLEWKGSEHRRVLDKEVMLPAAGQGALGIEVRQSDQEIQQMVAQINDQDSFLAVGAEREFLKVLGGGCRAPIACLGIIEVGQLRLEGAVFSLDGKISFRAQICGRKEEAGKLGKQLAESLFLKGAKEILLSLA